MSEAVFPSPEGEEAGLTKLELATLMLLPEVMKQMQALPWEDMRRRYKEAGGLKDRCSVAEAAAQIAASEARIALDVVAHLDGRAT